jgi:hypothetical protein
MNVDRAYGLEAAPAAGEQRESALLGADPQLHVTVVHTTPAGTVAALRAAADLAKQLEARISLLAPEIIPFLLPLDEPQVAVEFLKKRYCDLVASAGLVDQDVAIRILLCRDREAALQQSLAPHSLIVIGGSTRWWRRTERALAQRLGRLGHRVVFVDIAENAALKPEIDSGRQTAAFVLPQSKNDEQSDDSRSSRRGDFSSGNRGMGGLNRA